MGALTREKLAQAQTLLEPHGLDAWMVVVRETSLGTDPAFPLIVDGGMTWTSVFLVTPRRRIAVVGNYDADPLVAAGDWDAVVPYVEGLSGALREVLAAEVPAGGRIGLDWSEDDPTADGLSLGLWRWLETVVDGTPHAGAFRSAAGLVSELRGVKTPEELARIRGAIGHTLRLFDEIAAFARPGVTERAVYDHVHALMRGRGLGFSWDPVGDPIVNAGPDSMIGHGVPSATLAIAPGQIFHVDLGVVDRGYSSDLQRCWWVGPDPAPAEVRDALGAVTGAIRAGFAALRPGVRGWEVDAAARAFLVGAGWPEYRHAFGHQVGRVAHDGGTLLGPRWERYGRTPEGQVRVGEVYTLELGVTVPGRGYLGLEEMAVVTDDGAAWLADPQSDLPTL